jgi:integrase
MDESTTTRRIELLRRTVIFRHTKNGAARGVPLTTAVCALLEARERNDVRVFPVDITQAWHTAIDRAGVENFRFHDLRAAWFRRERHWRR